MVFLKDQIFGVNGANKPQSFIEACLVWSQIPNLLLTMIMGKLEKKTKMMFFPQNSL